MLEIMLINVLECEIYFVRLGSYILNFGTNLTDKLHIQYVFVSSNLDRFLRIYN